LNCLKEVYFVTKDSTHELFTAGTSDNMKNNYPNITGVTTWISLDVNDYMRGRLVTKGSSMTILGSLIGEIHEVYEA